MDNGQHLFLDYSAIPLALIGLDLLKSGYDVGAPHPKRRAFWLVVPPGQYSSSEIRPLLGQYMRGLEIEMQSVIECECLVYWLHVYRRLFPGCIGADKKPTTAMLVRSTMDAALQKYAPIAPLGRVAMSTDVDPSAILGGLLMSGEFRETRDFVLASPMLVLTDFGTQQLRELYDLEKLAYEVWRTSAMLRITGKGAPVVVDDSVHCVRDSRSDDLDDSVVLFDRRNERGAAAASSHTATVYSDSPMPEEAVVLPHFNVGGFVFEGEVLRALEAAVGARLTMPFKPNFLWAPMNLRAYYRAHRPFAEAFRVRHGVSLESVLCIVAALSRRAFAARSIRGPSWAFQQMQRGYEGPRPKDYILEELRGFTGRGLHVLGLDPTETQSIDVEAGFAFWELTDSIRAAIDVQYAGPHSVFVPFGEAAYYIDYAWITRRLADLFFGLTLEDQNFKGDALEEIVRSGVQALPSTPCQAADGTSRQVDASYRLGRDLVIAECRACWRSVAFERGEPSALAYRAGKIDEAIEDVDEKARWFGCHRRGRNYDASWASRVVPVVVTPFVEYLPTWERRYWLAEASPRVMTPQELDELMAAGDSSRVEWNTVDITDRDAPPRGRPVSRS